MMKKSVMKEVSPAQAFATFHPEHAVFVLSVDRQGKPNGMAAAWNMKCPEEPPMIAVAVEKGANTHKLISESREFVIAVPNKALEKGLLFFGSSRGSEVDKFGETGIRTMKARHTQTPLLADATINFECVLRNAVDAGDCTLFIGRVVASYANKGKRVLMYRGRIGGKRVFEEF